jgi:hypothetical protein
MARRLSHLHTEDRLTRDPSSQTGTGTTLLRCRAGDAD